jgi:hypothetical protein
METFLIYNEINEIELYTKIKIFSFIQISVLLPYV